MEKEVSWIKDFLFYRSGRLLTLDVLLRMALTEWTCGYSCSSKMRGNIQVYAPLEAEIRVLSILK